MKTVYVIGGMGAGKSTATRMLAALGAPVINLDEVGHEVLAWSDVRSALAKAFGDQVIDADGQVNRTRLAACAFATEESTDVLNSIVQTATLKRLSDMLDTYRAQDARTVIVECSAFRSREAAKLREDDYVLAIVAPENARIARAQEVGWSADDIEKRMAQQISDEERRRSADFTIENDGSTEELKQKIVQWWDAFQG